MKSIEIEELQFKMFYPVGENIQANITAIKAMAGAFNEIDEFKDKFVNIICRGSSGAIIGAIFSTKIKQAHKIYHFKKEGEYSHGGSNGTIYNGTTDKEPINIIIDDFIDSGETMQLIHNKLENSNLNPIPIHCLIVSGYVRCSKIPFKPQYVISGKAWE